MNTFLQFILIGVIGLAVQTVYKQLSSLGIPEIADNVYWGPGDSISSYTEDPAIKPFHVNVDEIVIKELRTQLTGPHSLHPPLEGINFEYGMNSNKLKELLYYWRDDYLPKWSERQKYLNSLPQFTTEIQGLTIHFVHKKGSIKKLDGDGIHKKTTIKTIPLLLLHGWPGSIREFYEIIELLTTTGIDNDNNIVFDVIAPSLPGYGWSSGAAKKGLGAIEMSIVLRNLMLRLGYKQFYIQGGDWGSIIGSHLATLHPENVIGYHSNLCFLTTPLSFVKGALASVYPTLFIDEKYVDFIYPLMDKWKFLMRETGFFHLQTTKPDTIGTALTDNPIGLAAYILEKFANLYERVPIDALIDNLMIYYVSNSIATSVRLYAESYSIGQLSYNMGRVPTAVPTGCVRFKEDIGHSLDWQLRDKYPNLIHSTFYDFGSHFAALETPNELYKDFITFVKIVQSKHDI